MKKIKQFLNNMNDISVSLIQIYGELNRIRLILGEKSKRGKIIEEFDKKYNYYFPFFDSEKAKKKYKGTKGEVNVQKNN